MARRRRKRAVGGVGKLVDKMTTRRYYGTTCRYDKYDIFDMAFLRTTLEGKKGISPRSFQGCD